MKLTSAQWQVLFPNPLVLDPDGWNRENFDYSWWKEKIDWKEYQARLVHSTVLPNSGKGDLLKRIEGTIAKILYSGFQPPVKLERIMQMVEAGITFEEQTVKEIPLEIQMTTYLDSLTITSDNIGDIRRSLFMPFKCAWNSWVRDETAKRERLVEQPNYTSKAKIEITL